MKTINVFPKVLLALVLFIFTQFAYAETDSLDKSIKAMEKEIKMLIDEVAPPEKMKRVESELRKLKDPKTAEKIADNLRGELERLRLEIKKLKSEKNH